MQRIMKRDLHTKSICPRRLDDPWRSGFTLIELIGTCILLGVLFSVTVPMLLIVARERHSNEQRQFAMQQAANLLELASTRSWSDLAPGELVVPELDADLRTVLPDVEQSLVSVATEGDLDSRQIIASIRWRHRSGQLLPPVELSTWVFQNGKAE